jgi:hypothetical protein
LRLQFKALIAASALLQTGSDDRDLPSMWGAGRRKTLAEKPD